MVLAASSVYWSIEVEQTIRAGGSKALEEYVQTKLNPQLQQIVELKKDAKYYSQDQIREIKKMVDRFQFLDGYKIYDHYAPTTTTSTTTTPPPGLMDNFKFLGKGWCRNGLI